jgi:hypothetical protein
MRPHLVTGLVLIALLPGPALADPPSGETVLACDSLVALRQLSAESGEDRARAAGHLSDQPGCRLVPRDKVGAVERRTVFGGAPYECLAQTGGGPCLWVMP